MKRKPITKKNKILRLCMLVFSVYAVVVLVGLQVEISDRQKELTVLKNELKQQGIENDEVERLLAEGEDQEYIERIARERLDFANPLERVFIDVSGS